MNDKYNRNNPSDNWFTKGVYVTALLALVLGFAQCVDYVDRKLQANYSNELKVVKKAISEDNLYVLDSMLRVPYNNNNKITNSIDDVINTTDK